MVKNVNQLKTHNNIETIVASGGKIFFVATDTLYGMELFVSYGTEAGTNMVKDINPGPTGSFNTWEEVDLIPFQGKVLFSASNGTNGTQLWISDGTTNGTFMLKVINSFSGSSPKYFIEYNNEVYFNAYEPTLGSELWKTDGTANGTVLVKEIKSGGGSNGSANPYEFAVYKNELYFRATDGITGTQIWKTNGTAAGTVRVSDINPGLPSGGSPQRLFVAGDQLFFVASDTVNGIPDRELWVTDGTMAGTKLVKNINPIASSNTNMFSEFNGLLFFKANDGIHGEELWRSDGTEAGTFLVKDINTSGHGVYVTPFVVYKGALHFVARGTGLPFEIWKTDGTEAGTVQVTSLITQGNSSPNTLFVMGNTLYFRAIYGVNGSNAYELFKTDGTVLGTTLTSNINVQQNADAGVFYFTPLNGDLYFAARDTGHGEELWKLEAAITFSNQTATVCDTFQLNDTTYITSGMHEYYLANQAGYDSLITIDLTVTDKPTISRIDDSLVSSVAESYKWQKNGVDIPGATSKAYKPTENANYSVLTSYTINSSENCEKTSETFNLTNVSVLNMGLISFSVYPNPAQTNITIQTNEEVESVKLFNTMGSLIQTNFTNTLSIESLPAGVYLLQIKTANGTGTVRLIKE